MTDKKPTTTENDEANEKTGAEDYEDYGNPVRQLERYITILDDFANETIRIRRASYEVIKNDDCFVFAEHDFLNDILRARRSMAALLKALLLAADECSGSTRRTAVCFSVTCATKLGNYVMDAGSMSSRTC